MYIYLWVHHLWQPMCQHFVLSFQLTALLHIKCFSLPSTHIYVYAKKNDTKTCPLLSVVCQFDVPDRNRLLHFVINQSIKLNAFAWKQYCCTAPLIRMGYFNHYNLCWYWFSSWEISNAINLPYSMSMKEFHCTHLCKITESLKQIQQLVCFVV